MVTSNALSLVNFNQLTPYAVGFERVFDQLGRYVTDNVTSTGFPPYNITKEGEYNFVIEMALAGFSKKDIEVEVKDNSLTIRSKHKETIDEKVDGVVHKGIASRNFIRSFALGEDIKVKNAKLENGLLTIDLEREIPEEMKPRLIAVH